MFDITPYQSCIHDVNASTIQRVIAVESGGNPLALNVNGLKANPHPTTQAEAVRLAQHYIAKGYSVDLGLMQINSRNLPHYGVTIAQMFTPCANIRTGSTILYNNYQQAIDTWKAPQAALRVALSLYNTGKPDHGFTNGYVRQYTHTGLFLHPYGSLKSRQYDCRYRRFI